jgi:D-alanine-D-alanine ligase
LCPAPFDEATTKRVQAAGLAAFRAIGGRDYSRVDVMVRANGDPVVLEVNTLPGMTETSLLPKAAAAAGISYADLCQRMVDLALQRR